MNNRRCLLTIIKLASQNIHNFMKVYHKIFILEQNSRNHESFCHESLEQYSNIPW